MGIRDLVREGRTIGDEIVKIQNKKRDNIWVFSYLRSTLKKLKN